MTKSCNECKVMKEDVEVIILKCTHIFCWSCINKHIKNNLNNKIKCQYPNCQNDIKDNEIRKVLSEDDIELYDELCMMKIQNGHLCILPECRTVSICNDTNIQFDCPNCTTFNCVQCKKAHKGMICGELVSRGGESLAVVCERELQRAKNVLLGNNAKIKRASIIETDKDILIPNLEIFTCDLCLRDIGKKMGIMLRQCFHHICRQCLAEHVKSSSSFPIRCPFSPCQSMLEDKECREILTETEREIYETRSITRATSNLEKIDHCRQFNCNFVCELTVDIRKYTCQKCKSVNCIECNTIHVEQSCKDYKDAKVSTLDEKNIEKLIQEKKLMRCLDCKTIINKTGGCNWIPCPQCGVELCWINQTYRWGPKGPGDTSGGCKCGVNRIKCHRDCGGCIPDSGRRHQRYANLRPSLLDPFNLSFDLENYFALPIISPPNEVEGRRRGLSGRQIMRQATAPVRRRTNPRAEVHRTPEDTQQRPQ